MSTTVGPADESAVKMVEGAAAKWAPVGVSTILGAPDASEPKWAKAAISVLVLLVFLVLVVVAYLTGDKTSFAILSGVGAGMGQQVIGYWIGSSSGSTQKTNLLAASPPIPLPGVLPPPPV